MCLTGIFAERQSKHIFFLFYSIVEQCILICAFHNPIFVCKIVSQDGILLSMNFKLVCFLFFQLRSKILLQ